MVKNTKFSSCEQKHSTPMSTSTFKRVTVAALALGLLAFTSNTAVANAAKKAAAEAAVAPTLVLPPISKLALVCLLPTLLGFYKSEYGVSYGYGTAIAASSYLVLSSIAGSAGLPLLPAIKDSISPTSCDPAGIAASVGATFTNLKLLLPKSLSAFHASALLFYGTRLDLFLLYRELFLERFRAMRERIEQRARKQGGRLTRTPFLMSCAFLYFCMMTPLLITSRLCGDIGMSFAPVSSLTMGLVPIVEQLLRLSVAGALGGFLLGAIGDLNKTIGKAIQGEDTLITGGVFRFFRHPNYTGEVIGWTSSCLAGFLAVALKAAGTGGGGIDLSPWKAFAPYLLLSVMGATGISFVLATAATGLEYRQEEKYGDTEKYKEWVKKSWVGFKVDTARKDEG